MTFFAWLDGLGDWTWWIGVGVALLVGALSTAWKAIRGKPIR